MTKNEEFLSSVITDYANNRRISYTSRGRERTHPAELSNFLLMRILEALQSGTDGSSEKVKAMIAEIKKKEDALAKEREKIEKEKEEAIKAKEKEEKSKDDEVKKLAKEKADLEKKMAAMKKKLKDLESKKDE